MGDKHKKEFVVYKIGKNEVEIRGDFTNDTLWVSQQNIVDIFSIDQSVVSRHIRNVFKDNEVDKESNMQKMHIANSDKPVAFYSLDVVLAVGYRTNSGKAIAFRRWATKTLKDHLLKGYTVNEKVLRTHTTAKLRELEKTIALMTSVKEKRLSDSETEGLLTVINQYTNTWSTLLAYDEGKLTASKSKKKGRVKRSEAVYADVALFKDELLTAGEATDLFARERSQGALDGILGNVTQSFSGKEVYPSIEEKAAHLLYFVVKNHPFSDGNKRTGAFLFLRFLKDNNHLVNKKGELKINQAALTALTLLVAESKPSEKEVMIALITNLIY